MVFFGEAKWKENRPAPVAVGAGDEADAGATPAGQTPAEVTASTATEVAEGHEGEHAVHPHESPWTMTFPLVVLAFLAAVAGFINLPFSFSTHWLEDWLAPVTGRYGTVLTYSNAQIVGLLAVSTVVAFAGIGLAYLVFIKHRVPTVARRARVLPQGLVLRHRGVRLHGRAGPTLVRVPVLVRPHRGRRCRQRHRRRGEGLGRGRAPPAERVRAHLRGGP